MKLSDVMNDYLASLKHEQGAARSTCNCYASWLHHFHRWLTLNGYGDDPDLDAFNTPVLRKFLYYLSGERKQRPRTIRGAFLPLKGLARFLLSNGVLVENPVASIQLPKKDAAVRLTVSDEEVRALLDGCEKQRNPKQVALARALFHVLIYGGLRRQELLDLRLGDVDAKEGRIYIRSGKGSKSRTIYVPAACIHAVQEWLTFRPKDCLHNFLFAFDRRRRLHGNGLMTIFEAVTAAAGLRGAPNVRPHALRHWRATDLLKSGADLRSIQAFLGHAALSVTQAYLHTDEERCRALADLSALQQPQAKSVSALAPNLTVVGQQPERQLERRRRIPR
ncbi:MAG TPA: tyrosine-type recombinase/integrase [Chthonomonadaceae bacterium]|nr:tyrosine-type recombinase/integrase [Chthonomonadaceae bacterium]